MAENSDFTVNFTRDDYDRMVQVATDRGYGVGRAGRGLTDYIRDCALGKFEPAAEASDGEHVRLAILIFGLATAAWGRVLSAYPDKVHHERAFTDALRDVLADAADDGLLG